MEKMHELLETASQLAEFGDGVTISKVLQILGRIQRKGMTEEETGKEFLKMMGLYYYQIDILGGGETNKKRFKDFTDNWLGIKCANKTGAIWENAGLAALTPDELAFVLGWAARVAKGRGKSYAGATGQNRKELNNKPTKVVYSNSNENDGTKELPTNLTLEEQMKMLANKFNQRKN